MNTVPDEFWSAFAARKGPCVLATTGRNGEPNVIYVGVIKQLDNHSLAIVDSAFHKTRENLLAGSSAAFLFITEEGKAYQAKGEVLYQCDADSLQAAKTWAPPMYEPKGVCVVMVQDVYLGALQLT